MTSSISSSNDEVYLGQHNVGCKVTHFFNNIHEEYDFFYIRLVGNIRLHFTLKAKFNIQCCILDLIYDDSYSLSILLVLLPEAFKFQPIYPIYTIKFNKGISKFEILICPY